MLKKYLYILICFFVIVTLGFAISIFREQEEIERNGIVFSHKSGFYNKDFYLKIKGKGDIYYTLDGSIPTKKSIKYTGPIHISDASKNSNTISMRKDISLMYNDSYKNFLIFPMNFRNYNTPLTYIDKCTVIRAVSIEENQKSKVKSASYFVGFSKKSGYDRINVVSIITDPKNLFDDKTGIYVNGNNSNELLKNYNRDTFNYADAWQTFFNYTQKGRNSEREAYLEFFNENKNFVLGKKIGIRIQGGYSRLLIQKSFNLYARREYDDVNKFPYRILNLNYYPDKMNLFSCSQDYIKWYDYIVHSLLKNNKNVSTLRFKPYAVFLNGEYWGFYWLTEKYDENYISHYYNIKNKKDIVYIKSKRIENGLQEYFSYYRPLFNILLSYDWSNEENYEQIKKIVDINSLINIYAVQIYVNNGDFGFGTNNLLFKTINGTAYKSKYAKWHFMLYDLNSAFVPSGFPKYLEIRDDEIYKKIMSNKETKHMLSEAIIKLSLNEFAPEKAASFIEKHKAYLSSAMLKNIERYHSTAIPIQENGYVIELYKLKKFFDNRPAEMYNEYCELLDLNQKTDKKVKDVCKYYRK